MLLPRIHFALLVVGLLALPARADTISVPGDFATIQDAVDAAADGDQIKVSKGTWEPFTVAGRTDLLIKGAGKPVLDGGGVADAIVTIANSDGITLDGFIIQNAGGRGVLITDSADVAIQRCTLQMIPVDALRAWASSGLLIEKNTFQDVDNGVDFSDESEGEADAAQQSVVQKNKFIDVGTGVDVDGSGHRIEKNTFQDLDSTAISLDSGATDCTLSKNKIANPDTAIRLEGSGHLVEKNKVASTRNEGIIVLCTGSRIEKNKLDNVDDDAIDLEADDNEIVSNKIKNTGDNGIELDPASGDPFPVTGNVLEKNKISASGGSGISIGCTVSGNTLVGNKASKSDDWDLYSCAAENDNIFDGNKFGTVIFD